MSLHFGLHDNLTWIVLEKTSDILTVQMQLLRTIAGVGVINSTNGTPSSYIHSYKLPI
jgi:hypothetical protein